MSSINNLCSEKYLTSFRNNVRYDELDIFIDDKNEDIINTHISAYIRKNLNNSIHFGIVNLHTEIIKKNQISKIKKIILNFCKDRQIILGWYIKTGQVEKKKELHKVFRKFNVKYVLNEEKFGYEMSRLTEKDNHPEDLQVIIKFSSNHIQNLRCLLNEARKRRIKRITIDFEFPKKTEKEMINAGIEFAEIYKASIEEGFILQGHWKDKLIEIYMKNGKNTPSSSLDPFLHHVLKYFHENNETIQMNMDLAIQGKTFNSLYNRTKDTKNKVCWAVTTFCNYRCSYCYVPQNKKTCTGSTTLNNYTDVINQVTQLEGTWALYLVGGEIFQLNKSWKIFKKVKEKGLYIDVSTNLSVPLENYINFVKKLGKNINFFQASFHPEFADAVVFVKKAIYLKNLLLKYNNTIKIAAVGTKNNITYLQAFGKFLNCLGFQFILQPPREEGTYKKKSFIENVIYNDFERVFGAHKTSLKEKYCRSGINYFLLLEDGSAWRCRTAAQIKDENKGYMGNMTKGDFRIYKEVTKCPFEMCTDITPHWNKLVDYTE